MNDSEIKIFFEDQTVFITGGTGFLGKVLIEKLLRTCNVRKIYALIRPKKGKTTQERINSFFDNACFNRLKREKPNCENLVMFINGDCQKVNMGINPEFESVLINEANVVIHAAANVKFEQTLREAANINVRSTRDILELAKKMPSLKAFVYISTAYSNCPRRHIGEKFYDPPISAKQLLSILDEMDDQLLNRISSKFVTPWPNTYTFTKCLAEDLLKTEGKDLSIAIVRPAIVVSTDEEPVPGWTDNFYGVTGIVVGAGLGVIRSLNAKYDNVSTLVPCDYVVNIVLASAWYTAKEKQDNIHIYNYVGSEKNLVTWRELQRNFKENLRDYPFTRMIWHYTLEFRENFVWHKICIFFQHTIVAYIVDFVLICLRREPIAVQNYESIDKMLDLSSYFLINNWSFDSDNVEKLTEKMGDADKRWFNFNMEYVDWKSWVEKYTVGVRTYLLRDPLGSIPQAKRKATIFAVAHYTLMTTFYVLLLSLFWWIFVLVS